MKRLLLSFLLLIIAYSCIATNKQYKIEILVHSENQDQIFFAKSILEARLKNYCKDTFNTSYQKNFISIVLPDTSNWNILQHLITDNGEISLSEIFDAQEIMPYITYINKVNEDNSKTVKPTIIDTIKLTKLDSFIIENPVFALLNVNIDINGEILKSPITGYVEEKDTANLSSLLNKNELQPILSDNVQFAYSKDYYNSTVNSHFYSLYALKNSTCSKINKYITAVTSVKSEYNRNGQNNIRIKLNSDGAIYFQNLTKTNTGKGIAIIIDGKVISAPIVNSEITGGTFEIANSFENKQEINYLQAVLWFPLKDIKLSIKEISEIEKN